MPADNGRAPRDTGYDAVTPVDASTVVLLRDRGGEVEVFMLERHAALDFVGGAYVFPGGKVDEADAHLDARCWSGLDPGAAGRRLRVDEGLAVAIHVAAVRETFEEAGVLLARRRGAKDLLGEEVSTPPFREARRRLVSRGERWDWEPWLRSEGLVLDLGELIWWAWWVTPEGVHRRFDTRFFVASLPKGQQAGHDAVETTASCWITPAAALAAARRGDIGIILPTRKNLEEMAAWGSVGEIVAAARSRPDPARIQPTMVVDDAGGIRATDPSSGDLEAP